MMKFAGSDFQLCRRLLRDVRAYWLHLAVLFILCILSTPLALLTPLPLKLAVDSVLEDHPPPAFIVHVLPGFAIGSKSAVLVIATALVVLVTMIDQARNTLINVITVYTGEKVVLDLRSRLFAHVQRLSFTYHDSKGIADSLYRIQNDATAAQTILLQGATPLIAATFTLLGMIYVTFRLAWQLSLIALAVCPILVQITAVSRRRQKPVWKTVKETESGAISVVQEALSGLRVVKAFAQEQREEVRLFKRLDAGLRLKLRLAFIYSLFNLLFTLTTAVGTAAVLYIGVRHVQNGMLTVGNLVLIIGYLAQLYLPAQVMSKTIADTQGALTSLSRVYAVLDQAPEVVEKPHARPLARATGEISLRHVSFAYEKDAPVLQDVSLDLPPGTRLGIKGVTGAGKTTLINLLSRFFDPSQGQILLDGVDLREYKLEDLRRQFAIVLQDPVLFSTTIAENIAYAKPDASNDEIIRAARAAHAHEFISQLPRGYETLVGERGMRLSGGERQRISLARAFLKNAPILILDEPTSSVDVNTETLIMQAMEQLMQGRTSLMIAHRLTTLRHCNAIIEIEDGHAVVSSPHVEAAALSSSPLPT